MFLKQAGAYQTKMNTIELQSIALIFMKLLFCDSVFQSRHLAVCKAVATVP